MPISVHHRHLEQSGKSLKDTNILHLVIILYEFYLLYLKRNMAESDHETLARFSER